MIRTIYLRDGTVIAGEPRMGAPSGPMTYVVENEDGWHTIMVDVVARVVDSQDDQGRCGAIGPLVEPPNCEHDWRSLPIDGDAASRGEPGANPGGVWPEHRRTSKWLARELASPIGRLFRAPFGKDDA